MVVLGGGGGVVVLGGGGGVTVDGVDVVVLGPVVVVPEDEVDSSPESAYCPWNTCHWTEFFGSFHWYGSPPPIAATMKSCQICAGNVPPATAMPCTLVISIDASG